MTRLRTSFVLAAALSLVATSASAGDCPPLYGGSPFAGPADSRLVKVWDESPREELGECTVLVQDDTAAPAPAVPSPPAVEAPADQH